MTNLRKYQISYQKCCHTSMKELKKSFCMAILLLMIPCFAFAQTTKRDIKLDFTNTSITKIIESIEKQIFFLLQQRYQHQSEDVNKDDFQ